MPCLKPVTTQLVAIDEDTENKNTLALHCHWIIKGVLGPELGKAYLMQLTKENERAAKSRYVKDGIDLMECFIRAKAE